jgi:gas vesicle protein
MEEVAKTPNLMFEVKTNCTGCHVEEKTAKGEKVISGSAKGCVDCHTKRHEAMLTEWKDKIKEELESISEVQKDAEDAIEKAKQENAPAEKLKTMLDSYNKGLETINIVKFGNGVHNKKYSIILIDVAFGHFEDTTDILSEE